MSHLISFGHDPRLQGVTAVEEGVHDQTCDHGQYQEDLGHKPEKHNSPESKDKKIV